MNLTYNLPRDFREDQAVVSLADAVGYANHLQSSEQEFAKEIHKELIQCVKDIISGEIPEDEIIYELEQAYYSYLDFTQGVY